MTKSSYSRLARIRALAAQRETKVDLLNKLTEPYGLTLHPTKGWRMHMGLKRDSVIQITEFRKRGLLGDMLAVKGMLATYG